MNNRKITQLTTDWKFLHSLSTEREAWVDEATGKNYEDSNWRIVSVPHDWAVEGEFSPEHDPHLEKVVADGIDYETMHVGRTGGLPIYGFGVYRKTFQVQTDSKNVFLEFDGVMANSEVYVNGIHVGGRPYGYSSFSVDCTQAVNFSGENLLVVIANPKERASRWYTGAGIYRPVRLVETSESYVTFNGAYVTSVVKESHATVTAQVEIAGSMEESTAFCEIFSPNHVLVARSTSKINVNLSFEFQIQNPQLWDLLSPVSYSMHITIEKQGKIIDQYITKFGIRDLSITRKDGVMLNGKKHRFHGVCLHHDLGPLGAAVDVSATRRQLEKMKEMGVNALRCTHNPASREFMDLADDMGFFVICEAFDEWKLSKVKNGYATLFPEWGEKDLVDLIRRDRNHPSVIMWSIGNEILDQNEPDGKDTAKFLHDICHREDPTRYTTFGINRPDKAISLGFCDQVDVVGFNYHAFKYEKYLKEHPDWIIYGSETESTVSSRGHYPQPAKNDFPCEANPTGHITSYDNAGPAWGYTVEKEFSGQDQSPEILGQFTWTGFDYLGEPSPFRNNWPSHVSYFGIFDLAGIPKDRYYMYKSRWTKEPVVHLLPHWNWHGYTNVDVHCHSNAHTVELFVNGKSIAVASKDPTRKLSIDSDKCHEIPRYRFIWENVPYEAGELLAVGYDEKGNYHGKHLIKTAGDPYSIALIPEKTSIQKDELSFVRVQILDKDGNLCPNAQHKISFTVSGVGEYVVADNGSQTSIRSFSDTECPVFYGQCIAVLRGKQSGVMQLKATGIGLEQGIASIFVDVM